MYKEVAFDEYKLDNQTDRLSEYVEKMVTRPNNRLTQSSRLYGLYIQRRKDAVINTFPIMVEVQEILGKGRNRRRYSSPSVNSLHCQNYSSRG